MPSVYGAIDLLQNELRQARVQNLASAPSSPVAGQLWYDSANNILKWWNGSTWIPAQSGGSLTPASTVTTQAVGDAPVVGTSANYAREDHKHGREAFGAITAETTFGAGSANGSAATLARSDHTHGNPTHDAAAHSAIPLSALAVPTATINLNNQLLTNVAAPVSGGDATNKTYVDNLTNGLSWKAPVRAYGAANLTLNGIPSSGLTDGVTLANGDRCLVNNQTTTSQNGIYVVNSAGAWARATDADSGAELVNATVYISEGTTYADTQWTCVTNAPITIGSTTVSFQQIAGAGTYTWGNGLTNVGNTVNVNPGTGITIVADAVTVDTSVIATQAFVTGGYQPLDTDLTAIAGLATTGIEVRTGAGTQATRSVAGTAPITVTNGDGVAGNPTVAVNAYTGGANVGVVPTGGTATTFLRGDGTWVTPSGTMQKYAAALTGNVAYATGEVVTHNLNTRDVDVIVVNGNTPWQMVQVDWEATSVNTVTIRYNPNLGAGFRVVVQG